MELQILLLFFFVHDSFTEKLSNKEAYENLKKTVQSVKKSCGDVCNLAKTGKPGKYFDEIEKDINCPALFSNPDIDLYSEFQSPPKRIPKWLRGEYDFNGKVEIVNQYLDDSADADGKHSHTFSKYVMLEIVKQFELDKFRGKLMEYKYITLILKF